jgi:hypothetical protein
MEKNKKELAIAKIDEAIRYAIKSGFRVVVASDDEGNGWNELNPVDYAMFYGEAECKPNMIVLGVYGNVDEDEVFAELKDNLDK